MIFHRTGFVNLQSPNLCTSRFFMLFASNHIANKAISPILNKNMTYKVIVRHVNYAIQPDFHNDYLRFQIEKSFCRYPSPPNLINKHISIACMFPFFKVVINKDQCQHNSQSKHSKYFSKCKVNI